MLNRSQVIGLVLLVLFGGVSAGLISWALELEGAAVFFVAVTWGALVGFFGGTAVIVALDD